MATKPCHDSKIDDTQCEFYGKCSTPTAPMEYLGSLNIQSFGGNTIKIANGY